MKETIYTPDEFKKKFGYVPTFPKNKETIYTPEEFEKKFGYLPTASPKSAPEEQESELGDLAASGSAIREKVEEPGFIEGLKESGKRQLSDPMAYAAGAQRGLDAWTSGGLKQAVAGLKALHPKTTYEQALREQQQLEKEDFEKYPLTTYPAYAVGAFTSPVNKLTLGGAPSALKSAVGAAAQTAIERALSGDIREADKNLMQGAGAGFAVGGALGAIPEVVTPALKTIGKATARTLTRSNPQAIEDYLQLTKEARKSIGKGEIEPTHKLAQQWEDQMREKELRLTQREPELAAVAARDTRKTSSKDVLGDLEKERSEFLASRQGILNDEDNKYLGYLDKQIEAFEAPEHLRYGELLEKVNPEQVIKYKENPKYFTEAPTFNQIAQNILEDLGGVREKVTGNSQFSKSILKRDKVQIPKEEIERVLNYAKKKSKGLTEGSEIAISAIEDTLRRVRESRGKTVSGLKLKELIQETQKKANMGQPMTKWQGTPEKTKTKLQGNLNEILKTKSPAYAESMVPTAEETKFFSRFSKDKVIPEDEQALTNFLSSMAREKTGGTRQAKQFIGELEGRQLGERTGRAHLPAVEQAESARRFANELEKSGYSRDEVDRILREVNTPTYSDLSSSRIFQMLPEAEKHGIGDILEKRIASPEYVAKRGEFTRTQRALDEQKNVAPTAASLETIGKGMYAPSKQEGTRGLDKLVEFDAANATDWAKKLQMSALASHFKSEGTAGSRTVQTFGNFVQDPSLKQMAVAIGSLTDIFGKEAVRRGLNIVADIEQAMASGRTKQALDMIRKLPRESVARELVNNFFPPGIAEGNDDM
jgi:hypothetical protein